MQNKLIEAVEAEYKTRQLPPFRSGDTVRVNFRIVEGSKERVQAYEGLVIAIHRAGVGSTFKDRKMVGDVGVERTFPYYSPRVESVEIKRAGRVRRAKLYYMRKLRGKAARIKERKKGF
ncbi:MAG: 50S ribosomal protein L19 [Deferribacteraceae bacterium]|jgi:large subunit ribosomal protein L19|nr:50S ribosomal protein L19 [Deferribacteraceae bacterium]